MGSTTPNPKKRGYLLPPGCKDLIHALQGPPPKLALSTNLRLNGQIKATEVRVIGERGKQYGIMSLVRALEFAKSKGVDLIEIAPTAKPPVCRLIDYGKFRSQQSPKKKRNAP